jgi:tRNA uridine 5-carboxymethylaminomethyl modification enzyme
MLIEKPEKYYDIIVIGGGHAGIEASLAAARIGPKTLLITMNTGSIGRLSCNPAIGGTAKGHLVREIDALGGEMGKIADATGIHFKMLNLSKGPAVWSPRSQNDRELYHKEAESRILNQKSLDAHEAIVTKIFVKKSKICGIELDNSEHIDCRCLIVCAGTFLNGLMHTGLKNRIGGRFGEPPAKRLTVQLLELGFRSGRLKTGTPPRIDINSISATGKFLCISHTPTKPHTKYLKRDSTDHLCLLEG